MLLYKQNKHTKPSVDLQIIHGSVLGHRHSFTLMCGSMKLGDQKQHPAAQNRAGIIDCSTNCVMENMGWRWVPKRLSEAAAAGGRLT